MQRTKKLLGIIMIFFMVLSVCEPMLSYLGSESYAATAKSKSEAAGTSAGSADKTGSGAEKSGGNETSGSADNAADKNDSDAEKSGSEEASDSADGAAEAGFRVIEITPEKADVYQKDENGKNRLSDSYRSFRQFWQSLTGRKAQAADQEKNTDEADDNAPLTISVSGRLPEDVTAEASFIEADEDPAYTERALFAIEIRLYDADGDDYIPEEPVKVTIGGDGVSSAIDNDNAFLVYSYAENHEREESYAQADGTQLYSADATVYKDSRADDDHLSYEVYDKEKEYKDGEDAVRFTEDKDGLTVNDDNSTLEFEYDFADLQGEKPADGEARLVMSVQKSAEEIEKIKKEQQEEDADTKDKDASKEEKKEDTKKTSSGGTLTATDGKQYKVTVTYSEEAGLPDDAKLEVEMFRWLKYIQYKRLTANALDEDSLDYFHAFDITIVDEKGKEYQPEEGVKVSIEMLNEKDTPEELQVIHFDDKNKTEILESETDDSTVSFTAYGFSVYALVENPSLTYIFYMPPADGPVPAETVTDSYYEVSDWLNDKFIPIPINIKTKSEPGEAYTQKVKRGEKPIIPQTPTEIDGKTFIGWFEGSPEGQNLRIVKTEYDFSNTEKITENKTVRLFARYSDYCTVSFHDQYDEDLGDYPVGTTRIGEKSGGSATVDISDVNAVYNGGSDMAFYGWSEEPIRNPGEGKDKKISGDTITVTGNKDLYPIFMPVHWLYYYSAESGSGATYIPTAHYFEDEGETQLEVPVWDGHTFEGWYTGVREGSEITYSVKVTNEKGEIENIDLPELKRIGGKLILLDDVTLYAKWSEETTVDYKIIIWRQKTTDPEGLPAGSRHYDFYESHIKNVPVGSPATIDPAYKQYNTHRQDLIGYTCRADADVDPVNPKGYTVLNVYYDRNGEYTPSGSTHKLEFMNSSDEAISGLPVTYNEVAYGRNILTGNEGRSFVPENPSKDNFTFTGWFADKACTTQVFFDQASYDAYTGYNQKVLYDTMPDYDLKLYAGWEAEWYLVQVDPNYGTFNGSGSTWFWETVDGDLVQEYTQVTRDYVKSSSGEYYYEKKDRAYYGYSGTEYDKSEPDRDTYYTKEPGRATEDTTFEPAAGAYSYAGWYEVHADGSETPYDFTQHVDHHTTIKLHWKRNGAYYIHYNTTVTVDGEEKTGTLSGSQDKTAYGDNAKVRVQCSAEPPSGYTFAGWKVRGDSSGRTYSLGQTFLLPADNSVMVGGKKTVYLDAAYVKADTAKIIYNANGGTINPDPDVLDIGECDDVTGDLPFNVDTASGTVTVEEIPNNSSFRLSDGSGYSKEGAVFMGWSDKPVCDSEEDFYDTSKKYGIDTNEPVTLYAVWGVKVKYHKNNLSADWTEVPGEEWINPPYQYEEIGGEGVYTQTVYIGNSIKEPVYIPTQRSEGENKIFNNWSTDKDENVAYDFSKPVTAELDLYAYWTGPKSVIVHGVDASGSELVQKDGASGGWAVPASIETGMLPKNLDGSIVTAPNGYEFAFAAAHDPAEGLQNITEDEAVTSIRYSAKEKSICVKYKNETGFTKLNNGYAIYFVYYQKKSLDVAYSTMAESGKLAPTSIPEEHTGDLSTENVYDMKASITDPLYKAGNDYPFFAYAVGKPEAQNASDLNFITDSSDSNDERPDFKVRNTWKGFQYSSDGGENWTNCGYSPKLYVVYFTKKPTVIVFKEETFSKSDLVDTEFKYDVVVTQTVGTDDPEVIYDTGENPFILKNGEAQSAILFYSEQGGTVTKQTITITQHEDDRFNTTLAVDGGEASETRTWTYTSDSVGGTKNVVFTNKHKSEPVEIHVALAEENGIVIRDDLRSEVRDDYILNVGLGSSGEFDKLKSPEDVFYGDSTHKKGEYAFGAVVYGSSDEAAQSPVTDYNMNVSEVGYLQLSENNKSIYGLQLKDKDSDEWYEKDGSKKVYFLYYRMPKIRYEKEVSGGALSPVRGSLDGSSVVDDITYNGDYLEMNGMRVVQDQSIEIPMDGFVISQTGGVTSFHMPPILDDGTSPRYLEYKKLGAGRSGIQNIEDFGTDISDGLKMYLKVEDNKLKFSFNKFIWKSLPLSESPTIYAVYKERGYDLEITKSVPIDVGGDKSFDISITPKEGSFAQDSYEIEGYEESRIEVRDNKIELEVHDGSDFRIKGLERGIYTVTETDNANYILTAKTRPISGGSATDLDINDNSYFDVELEREKKLEITNTSKAICKITNGGREILFYSIQSAVEYVKENLSTTADIEMLTDYVMPSTDVPVIPLGYTIKLTTAYDGEHQYEPGLHPGATIKRAADNPNNYLISNAGTLTLDELWFDGGNSDPDVEVTATRAMVHSTGSLKLNNVTLENAKNSGNGGAVYAESGSVDITGTIFNNNTANEGGAVYSEGSSIAVSDSTGSSSKASTFKGNSAVNGGAIYYKGSGEISLSDNTVFGGSGDTDGNTATNNGGAIYATSGTVKVSGNALLSGNSADNNGGAIYSGSGTVKVEGGIIGGSTPNTADNGSAVYIYAGTANFTGGRITGNVSREGGAVGVGTPLIGTSIARLYFSGSPYINGNTSNESVADENACNVYLDQDTDSVINAAGIDPESGDAPYVGIYVPNRYRDHGDEEYLFVNRGLPGCKFGIYTNEANLSAFHNDRVQNLTAFAETDSRRVVWGKPIQVQVRYLASFSNGFPQKSGNNWNGTQKKGWFTYYLPSNENATSEIADDLRLKEQLGLTNTAAFAYAFLDNGDRDITFDNYLTDVNWSVSGKDWEFVKRDGTGMTGTKLVVYFAEPAYVTIENNTSFKLESSNTDLTLLGKDVVNDGYGYLYSVNEKVQSKLRPVGRDDLNLNAGKSVKLMFPGGAGEKLYTFSGGFVVGSSSEDIPVKQTGVSDRVLSGTDRESFSLEQGKTGKNNGSTVEIVFGGKRKICKIVRTQPVTPYDPSETEGTDDEGEGKTAYLFSTLNQAVNFAKNHALKDATIEMITDYMIPASDTVNLPADFDKDYTLTFTTAIGDTENHYNYSSDPKDRATISRDTGNNASFIKSADGKYLTLKIQSLVFDGKNFAGSIDGGVIATKNCNVEIDKTDFNNCVANNGGGIYIDFTPNDASYDEHGLTLTVTDSNFSICKSTSQYSRQGGGAIWTTAKTLTVKDCTFDSCTAIDQGGAVFHRIDTFTSQYPTQAYSEKSKTDMDGCKFTNCSTRSGGAVEFDSFDINVSGCRFENCNSAHTARGYGSGGALNTYIYERSGGGSLGYPYDTKLKVADCYFINCTTTGTNANSNGNGGAIRSNSYSNEIRNCTFEGCVAEQNGGAIAFNNKEAGSADIIGCTVKGCSAKNGGGIYISTSSTGDPDKTLSLLIDGGTIQNNTASSTGGGIYTNANMILRNDASITGNHLSSATVTNAAGVYINNKTLTVGSTEAFEEGKTDNSSISGNTVSGGGASNVRLWYASGKNDDNSVHVLCDLGGSIGVINHGPLRTQFGVATNSTSEKKTSGLSDDNHVFVADDGSTYGIIERTDPDAKKIIWAAPPICKITDYEGNILYLDQTLKNPAVFDLLDNSNHPASGTTSAFACLRSPNLFDKDGNEYPASDPNKPYYVKMLVERYEVKNYITTNGNVNRTIYLTTAESKKECEDDYPYRGTPGSHTTLVKTNNIKNNNLITAKNNMIFENITLDGGYSPSSSGSVESTSDGGILSIKDNAVSVTIGQNATLQNAKTSKKGGAIWMNAGRLIVRGIINGCISADSGGGVYAEKKSEVSLEGGSIKGCSAANGGGVYFTPDNQSAKFTMSAGSIRDCTASNNGGGVCLNNSSFVMDGGTINGCTATSGSGGGVYVANNRTFTMANAFITGNYAGSNGGGIAVGGGNSRLIFRQAPYVSGNTSNTSIADGKTCNVQLDYGFNYKSPEVAEKLYGKTVIECNGLNAGARIGIYVPDNLYENHGDEGDPFGTFNDPDQTGTLYGFINDRNGLKGGLTSGQDKTKNDKIYWVKIFSIEVSKDIDSSNEEDRDQVFHFRVTLSGTADDGTPAESVTTPQDDPTKYGQMTFNRGVAEFDLSPPDEDGEDTGERLPSRYTGEFLPAGLMYKVEEVMTTGEDGQDKVFAALPYGTVREGMIGENADSTTANKYVSFVEFINMRPVCKVTRGDSTDQKSVLYQKVTYDKVKVGPDGRAERDSEGKLIKEKKTVYIPAVYKTLDEAFESVQGSGSTLFFKSGANYLQYNDQYYYNIKMLVPSYNMTDGIEISNNKKIGLSTAAANDPEFPRQYDSTNVSVVRRSGFTDKSMFKAKGDLRLTDITLDGYMTRYTATVDGGIVNVPNGGELSIGNNATLRSSKTSGNGGGVYVAEGGKVYLSGKISFGGTGVYGDKTQNTTQGNFSTRVVLDPDARNGGMVYTLARQDIYLAANDPNNTLVVTGNLDCPAGSIWVWVNALGHKKSFESFATTTSTTKLNNATYKAFRNAMPDKETGADEIGTYLWAMPGEEAGVLYWYGVTGSRRVVLRKVDGSYDPLSGASFRIYPEGSETPYNTGGSNTTSRDSGIIWIGDLPLGGYLLQETNMGGRWYYLIVDEEGVYCSLNGTGRASSGYSTRADAQAALNAAR